VPETTPSSRASNRMSSIALIPLPAPWLGDGGDVSARVGARGDHGESARINERAYGEAVREDRKPTPKHISSLSMSLDSLHQEGQSSKDTKFAAVKLVF